MAEIHEVQVKQNQENSSIFKIFNTLLNSKDKKEKSCAALVDFLKSDSGNVGSSSAGLYSAKRLVRGFGTTEPEKQNIFFSALCTSLTYNVVTLEDVLAALQNVLENIGSAKSEQSKANVTSILTYGALVKSENFLKLSEEDVTSALSKLLQACASKSYVKAAASTFLIALVNQCGKDNFKTSILPSVKTFLNQKNLEDVDSNLWCVWAHMYVKFQKISIVHKLMDSKFGGRHKFFEDLVLRAVDVSDHLKESLLTTVCIELALHGDHMIKIWNVLISDEDRSTSPKWNSYILLVASIVMDTATQTESISKVLKPLLLDILLKSLQAHDKKSKTEVCYIRSRHFLERLIARVTSKDTDSKSALKILKIFLSHPGGLQFDRKTRTGTIQAIVGHLENPELVSLASEFKEMVTNSFDKEKEPIRTVKDLEIILSMLVKLLGHPHVKKNQDFVLEYSKFIFDVAFKKSTPIGLELRGKATDLFFKSLDFHQVKIEEIVSILNGLVSHANENLEELTVTLKDSSKEQWKNMLSTNGKLAKSSDKKYVAVRLLLLHMGLLMLRDQILASSTIEELLQCYQRIKAGIQDKKNVNDEEPHWVEVTVDLLLAMLSRENKLLRHVVGSVFSSIVPDLTATALQQILDALDPLARNDVLKHVDSDDSDVEEAEVETEEGENEEDEEDESAGSDGELEEETVNDKLRMAVRNALGYSAALTDDESVDMDVMTEEEERRLNESLGNAFRLFRPNKGSKKKQSKDEEALSHFRVRVLDLVDIIVSNNPPIASCLDVLDPLITLLEVSIKDQHQRPLQNRLETVLKKLGAVKKFGEGPKVANVDVVAALKRLFERETSGLVYGEMSGVLTECAAMLIRAEQVVKPGDGEETCETVFRELLVRHFKTGDRKVPFGIFQSVLRVLWNGNWSLSEQVMTLLLDPDLKVFKKIKLLELLEIFYKNDRLQSTATDDCKKKASSFEAKFVKNCVKSLKVYDDTKNSKLLPAFFGRLVMFIQQAMLSTSKYRADCTPAPVWSKIVSHLLGRAHIFSQQKARNKLFWLAKQCGFSVPGREELRGKKRRPSDVAEDEVPEKVEKTEKEAESSEPVAKRKKTGQGRKMRQEARDLRLATSSQGLSSTISFTQINLEDLGQEQPDSEDDEEAPEPPPKVKKTEKKKR